MAHGQSVEDLKYAVAKFLSTKVSMPQLEHEYSMGLTCSNDALMNAGGPSRIF